MATPYVLFVALLRVQSSYLKNIEQSRGAIPDTVQFWYSPDADWRIKTFAIDHDIHIHEIRPKGQELKFSIDDAAANTRKHYSDVIEQSFVFDLPDPTDHQAVVSTLKSHGVRGSLEIGKSGVAFYNPDGGRYRTQSSPEQD